MSLRSSRKIGHLISAGQPVVCSKQKMELAWLGMFPFRHRCQEMHTRSHLPSCSSWGVIESSSPSSGLDALEAVVSFEHNTEKPRLHPGTSKLELRCGLKNWPFSKHPSDPTPQVTVLPLANFIWSCFPYMSSMLWS